MKLPQTVLSVSAVLVLLQLIAGSVVAGEFEGSMTSRHSYFALDDLRRIIESEEEAREFLFSNSVDDIRALFGDHSMEDGLSQDTWTIRMKGDQFRVDATDDGEKQSFLYNSSGSEMITLLHNQQVAMVISLAEHLGMGDETDMFSEEEGEGHFSLAPTGKEMVIHDLRCQEYIGTDSDGDALQAWIHSGKADWYENLWGAMDKFAAVLEGDAGEDGVDKEEAFYRKTGFPVVSKTISMEDVNINEILSIGTEGVSDDLFTIPAGYQRVTPRQMMQMEK